MDSPGFFLRTALVSLAAAASSCVNVHVDPIYAKVDINIKVDQELDSFFNAVAARQSATAPVSSTAPVAATAPAAPTSGPATAPATLPAPSTTPSTSDPGK